jgi:hypothetical protein
MAVHFPIEHPDYELSIALNFNEPNLSYPAMLKWGNMHPA